MKRKAGEIENSGDSHHTERSQLDGNKGSKLDDESTDHEVVDLTKDSKELPAKDSNDLSVVSTKPNPQCDAKSNKAATIKKLYKDYELDTPLHAAINERNFSEALRLIELEKTDVMAKNIKGNTPLHYCAAQGNIELFEKMSKKCPIRITEIKNNLGMTIAHAAAYEGQKEFLNYLLKTHYKGVNPKDIKDRDGNNLGYYAIFRTKLNVLVLLVNNYAYKLDKPEIDHILKNWTSELRQEFANLITKGPDKKNIDKIFMAALMAVPPAVAKAPPVKQPTVANIKAPQDKKLPQPTTQPKFTDSNAVYNQLKQLQNENSELKKTVEETKSKLATLEQEMQSYRNLLNQQSLQVSDVLKMLSAKEAENKELRDKLTPSNGTWVERSAAKDSSNHVQKF